MRRRVADLGKIEPGIAVLALLILQGALKFIVINRFESLAIVKRWISCGFQLLNDPRIDLLMEQLAMVLLKGVVDTL